MNNFAMLVHATTHGHQGEVHPAFSPHLARRCVAGRKMAESLTHAVVHFEGKNDNILKKANLQCCSISYNSRTPRRGFSCSFTSSAMNAECAWVCGGEGVRWCTGRIVRVLSSVRLWKCECFTRTLVQMDIVPVTTNVSAAIRAGSSMTVP